MQQVTQRSTSGSHNLHWFTGHWLEALQEAPQETSPKDKLEKPRANIKLNIQKERINKIKGLKNVIESLYFE
ncbi:hypothetical protein EBR03_05615 [bacterium]|nr:hypothetical protein [bacterium]NBX82753.1 hypothetical protein [bacterium]